MVNRCSVLTILGVSVAGFALAALQLPQTFSTTPSPGFGAQLNPVSVAPVKGGSGAALYPDGTEIAHEMTAQGVMVERTNAGQSYSYMSVDQAGNPARWDKCKPITYRINARGMSKGIRLAIPEAMKQVSKASGLKLVKGKPIRVIPYSSPKWFDDLWRSGSNVVVIAVGTPKQVPILRGAAGYAGAVWQQMPKGMKIRVGGVVLNKQAKLGAGFDKGAFINSYGQLLLHELGHAMNLGHVLDEKQIMFPAMLHVMPDSYQSGDRAGFRGMFSLPCF